MKKHKINKAALKWVHGIARTAKGSLTFLFIIKVIQGVMGILFAFMLRSIIDSATAGDRDTFFSSMIFGIIIVLAQVILYWLSIYYKEKPAALLTKNLRIHIFGNLMTRSYSDFSKVHTGEWMTMINSDASIIANAITALIPGTAGFIVQLVCAFAAMFIVLPRMAWILIPIGLAMIALSLFMRIKLKAFHKEVQRNEGLSQSYMQESLGSMPVIFTYTREEQTKKEAKDRLSGLVTARLKRIRFFSWCSSGVVALIGFGYLIGVVICGFKLLDGVITYGMMAAVLQLIRQADQPMAEVTSAFPQFFNMIASAERIMEIEKLDTGFSGTCRSPEKVRHYYEKDLSCIKMSDVHFSYTGSEDVTDLVLTGMNLEIEKGDYVAFTGESGCGKSTTMNILMGLYKPCSGKIYIEKRGGKKEELNASWRALFAYVPQKNMLMSGRIRDVVAFADPDSCMDEERIRESLKIACAESFVNELPDGLDTWLGERGSGLSEGQMQRLAIARAIFSKRPIIMLDESTSALDGDTEEQLLNNLKRMTDRTVVIITHRPAALQICNKQKHFTRNPEKIHRERSEITAGEDDQY